MKALTLIAMLAVVACESPLEPLVVTGVRPATPEEVERAVQWYASTTVCANRHRNGGLALIDYGARVRWFVADEIRHDGEPLLGGAQRADTVWVRTAAAPYISAWRHELFHHLLWSNTGNGDHSHRDARWPVCAD